MCHHKSFHISAFHTWWRHQMETFSALLALCEGNSPVTGEFPSQWPVTGSFDVFFDLHPKKRLSKQSRCWWYEKPSCPFWRNCNDKPASQNSCSSDIGKRWLIYNTPRVRVNSSNMKPSTIIDMSLMSPQTNVPSFRHKCELTRVTSPYIVPLKLCICSSIQKSAPHDVLL